jgi:membrane-bound serine protease (ClpP class)
LILLAIIMFIAEIKVASHGILTMGGLAAMILGSLMLIDTQLPQFQISLWAILGTAGATAFFFMVVVGAGVKALWSRTTTGKEGLIGEIADVRIRLAPAGQVFLQGALWNAVADQEVEAGQLVRIIGIDGLTLKVEPVQRATADVPSVATGRSA